MGTDPEALFVEIYKQKVRAPSTRVDQVINGEAIFFALIRNNKVFYLAVFMLSGAIHDIG